MLKASLQIRCSREFGEDCLCFVSFVFLMSTLFRGISFEMTTDGCEIETNPVPLPSSTLSPGQTVRLVFTFAEKDEDEELEEDEELDEDEIVQNVRVRVDRIEEGIERDGEQVYRGQLLDEMHSLFEFLVPGLYVWFTPSEVFAVGDGDV